MLTLNNHIIEQEQQEEYQELKKMLFAVLQLTEKLGLSQQSSDSTQTALAKRSLSPVKRKKRVRPLSPLSISYRKTLHVSHISL
jgi:hypothetical protein